MGTNRKPITLGDKSSFLKMFESLFLYFTFIFIAMFAHPKLTYEFSTSKYFFLIIFFTVSMTLYLIRKIRDKDAYIYFTWAHLGWFLFGIAAVLSTFNVLKENPLYFSFSFEIGIYAFLTGFMVLYFSNFLEEKRAVTYFLLAVMTAGTMVAIEALYNYYTGQSFFLGAYGNGGKMSIKATIGNPNFVSDFLGSLLPITAYFALSYDFGWKPKDKKQSMKLFIPVAVIKTIGLINFAIFYFLVLVIGTRAVILSLGIGAVVFVIAWLYYKNVRKKEGVVNNYEEIKSYSPKLANTLKMTNRIFLIVLLVIALSLPIILSNPKNPLAKGTNVAERTSSIFDARGFQTTGGKARVFAWKASVYQFKDYPIIGNGIGTYMLRAVDYMGDVVHDEPQYVDGWSNFKRTHNDYFQVLGEMGLLGILSVVITLVILIIMFFKMLKDQENPDDAILLIMLAVAFTEILGHSFTEFPLHLLPNQLWALAIAGLGFGRYFNKKRRFEIKLNMGKVGILVLMFVVIGVGIMAGTLKFKSMMAEAFFKNGNGYYSSLGQVESQINQLNQQKTQVEQMEEMLASRTGQYAVLEPNTYIARKKAEMGSMVNNINDAQLRVNLLNELEKEIKGEEAKIASYYQQIDDNLAYLSTERFTRYQRGLSDFLASLDYSHCYGKSMFYMSLMMIRPERKELMYNELNSSSNALETLRKQFTQKSDEMRYIQDKYLEFPLKDDLAVIEQLVAQGNDLSELLSRVDLSLWYDIQRYQSGIDYFESSFQCFNEKNSYKILGNFNYNYSVMLKNLANRYRQIINQDPTLADQFNPLIELHQNQAMVALGDFKKWYDTAIYKLPANWNLFPDWEGIYSEYIDLLLKSDSVLVVYPKVKEVAEKRVWASEQMHNVQRPGVPDDIESVYAQIAQAFLEKNLYQESIYVLDDGLKLLKVAYDWCVEDLKTNTYLTDDERKRYQSFVSNYESLVQKRAQFMDQIVNVYTYANNNGDFDSKWLDDWKLNQFTGERWDDANFDEIMTIIQEAKDNPPVDISK